MEEVEKKEIKDLIEVTVSSDGMTAFIKLLKDEDDEPVVFRREELMEALEKQGVTFGINENVIKKLLKRPIYNLKLKIASGTPKENGKNGTYKCLIRQDGDYHPVFDENEKIDYKNISCFQTVGKDQTLCTIEKETAGEDGTDVFGQPVAAKPGQKASIKSGKNTYFTDDGTELRSACEGVVKYIGHLVNVNNILHVKSNVDINTGNIDFPGDVTIDGDLCCGYKVKTKGNLVIKGVVEEAEIEADGNVHIAKGINSGRIKKIKVGKILRSKYIQSSNIEVGGDIFVDHIIDSLVICKGNIKLSGEQEVIAGGQISLGGELVAKELGTDREYPTLIEIIGKPIIEEDLLKKKTDKIEKKKKELDQTLEREKATALMLAKQKKMRHKNEEAFSKIAKLAHQLKEQKERLNLEIEALNEDLENYKKNAPLEFYGSVVCRRKLYQGVKIAFGNECLQFESDYLEHCRIYWDKGEIVQGIL